MRDPKRIRKILGEINRLWSKHSDMRFGQLVNNLYYKYCFDVELVPQRDYFNIEDDGFLKWLETFEGFE